MREGSLGRKGEVQARPDRKEPGQKYYVPCTSRAPAARDKWYFAQVPWEQDLPCRGRVARPLVAIHFGGRGAGTGNWLTKWKKLAVPPPAGKPGTACTLTLDVRSQLCS